MIHFWSSISHLTFLTKPHVIHVTVDVRPYAIIPLFLAFSTSLLIISGLRTESGFLVRVHPEPCLILSRAQIRAQIRALLCSSKSKLIPASTLTLLVLDKKTGLCSFLL
jgi:hypothetical protein